MLAWLSETAFAAWVRGGTWTYPLIEAVHIAAFAVLVGAVVVLDLRLLGMARALDVRRLARLAHAVAMPAAAVAAVTGLSMFIARGPELWPNLAFRVKLVLLAGLAVNAAIFHMRDVMLRLDPWARLQVLASLAGWFAVIIAGRLIAYV
jgi:hypothetical protein